MNVEDKAEQFLHEIAKAKGETFAQVVNMAAVSKAAMMMLGACNLPRNEKLQIGEIQAEFNSMALSFIADKCGLVPREIMQCADMYTSLATEQARAMAAQKTSVPGNSTIN